MAASEDIIDPRYSIGVAAMDREHARWIVLIEKFRVAAAGHLLDSVGVDAARRTLSALCDYTQQHFASEERLLAACAYPDLAAHKLKHLELVEAVAKLSREVAEHQGSSTPLKLNLFVTVWLLEHIMTEDWKYARFVRQHSPES